MSYKTILVHVEKSKHLAGRVALAAQLANRDDAHLVGAAMTGLSQFIYQCASMAPEAAVAPADLSFLNERADAALADFEAEVTRLGVKSFEHRRIDDESESGLTLQARYADLVIVGQTDPDEPSPNINGDLPQYVMLHSARPVLVVPYAGKFDKLGEHVLLAWDGSAEATRAITCAIPLLRRANKVTLAVFNPYAEYNTHGAQPGADMALYLARHGIKVEVLQQATDLDIGNALLSLAADIDVDLLVMGGYGHSRVREVVLGGVTKTILAEMTLPVLMAH
ncbi:universal stress protein [Duganella sp. LX20W]|uniref:Universal stress protein n=1 Tax=Rugamonas brunnea TaxID=2758569 RepID=A0A7W2EUE1_9BURK|nr:universal stress protein [Rugamonas brunnea]MBA5638794.1 universal stress protein [Rugamonas brunnea]